MWTVLTAIVYWTPFLAAGSAVDFIFRAAADHSLSVIIIRTNYCPHTWEKEIFKNQTIPVVVLSDSETFINIRQFSRPLHVVCLPGHELQKDLELMENFTNSLNDFPSQKKIVYISNRFSNRSRMDHIFETCYHRRIWNVVGLLAADEHLYFYRYNLYPSFRMEHRALESSTIFDNGFPNMQGHPLIVMPDQWLPRSVLYVDRRTGKQVLAGSVGRFFHVLSWKLNATLQLSKKVTIGRFLNASALKELSESFSVDVPASLTIMERVEQLASTSYPMEVTHVCLMVPVARKIPIKDIYFILSSVSNMLLAIVIVFSYGLALNLFRKLTHRDVHLVDFLLNDKALRGILGQSFNLPMSRSFSTRFIFLMLGIVGLNVSSIFGAALDTLMAHPPRQFQARSFADLRRTKIPLVTTEEDFPTWMNLHVPMLVVNVSEYNHLRNGRNSSNSYFASRLYWNLFSEQQKRFTRELFIYSTDDCLWSLALLSFQWPQNSLFTEPVSQLILEVNANGLYDFWVGMHYYDMSAAGLSSLEDPSLQLKERVHPTSLRIGDLQWMWQAYGTFMVIAMLVFLLEVSWHSITH
ncbi:uncharacterized protein LOC6546554 [Drosophila erecta]|uniref:Ionotropic glutamate receptor C-terminal domain-containing protein n=1 Tax=Drosophila erecta TaxID=7220 RepID=B3NMM9_DROER|nr:uncharacterized protein LOC6546554 [Drosophila erecta]EDV54968.2 uncharacterized protein Dere_GG21817 [Drosophila erecta]